MSTIIDRGAALIMENNFIHVRLSLYEPTDTVQLEIFTCVAGDGATWAFEAKRSDLPRGRNSVFAQYCAAVFAALTTRFAACVYGDDSFGGFLDGFELLPPVPSDLPLENFAVAIGIERGELRIILRDQPSISNTSLRYRPLQLETYYRNHDDDGWMDGPNRSRTSKITAATSVRVLVNALEAVLVDVFAQGHDAFDDFLQRSPKDFEIARDGERSFICPEYIEADDYRRIHREPYSFYAIPNAAGFIDCPMCGVWFQADGTQLSELDLALIRAMRDTCDEGNLSDNPAQRCLRAAADFCIDKQHAAGDLRFLADILMEAANDLDERRSAIRVISQRQRRTQKTRAVYG